MNTAYYLVFDGLADWEAALALAELQKSGTYTVRTVGFTPEPIRTMGGITVVPDTTDTNVSPERSSLLILPGGEWWEHGEHKCVTALLRRFNAAHATIAAICGATLAVAHAGLLNSRCHTSNSAQYISSLVPFYTGAARYADSLAVCDDRIITASGVGSVEFAREILEALAIYDDSTLAKWFALFKHGVLPS